ncbi:MAG: cytochrome c5 [Paraglaciecola psychrophila]|jgi:cytochrome c5
MHSKRISLRLFFLVTMIAMVAALSGCGGDKANTALAGDATGGINNIARVYNTSCISCHARGNAGAPRAHNVEDWQPKLAKGMAVLLANVKNGFGTMPAKGMCYDCDDEQLLALINYMAAPVLSQ